MSQEQWVVWSGDPMSAAAEIFNNKDLATVRCWQMSQELTNAYAVNPLTGQLEQCRCGVITLARFLEKLEEFSERFPDFPNEFCKQFTEFHYDEDKKSILYNPN
jgi:hypothetical protein